MKAQVSCKERYRTPHAYDDKSLRLTLFAHWLCDMGTVGRNGDMSGTADRLGCLGLAEDCCASTQQPTNTTMFIEKDALVQIYSWSPCVFGLRFVSRLSPLSFVSLDPRGTLVPHAMASWEVPQRERESLYFCIARCLKVFSALQDNITIRSRESLLLVVLVCSI